MKNKRKYITIIVLLLCTWSYNPSFCQSINNLKIEKKLHKLYTEKGNLKKCNRVAKRYIKKRKAVIAGLNSAYYYTALSYIYYPNWNWTRWRILHGESNIMETYPLNYVDSALKYNDLYLKNVDKGSIKKSRWQEELYNRLDFEINYVWENQLIIHKYPEYEQNPVLIYANHKAECDSVLQWVLKLHLLAKDYYPEKYLETYVNFHMEKNNFLGSKLSNDQLDTIYNQFNSYMALNDNIEFYSSRLPYFMEIDTFQFYRFLHLIEAYDSTYTLSNYFDWNKTTNGYGYDKKYITIWEPIESEEDAGTFLVTDSIRNNQIGYTHTYSIPFKYKLYPGDTMRFHRTDNTNFVITNLRDLQEIKGSGTDTIIVQFTNPTEFTFAKQMEWDKRERKFTIITSRGKYHFKFIYRVKYIE